MFGDDSHVCQFVILRNENLYIQQIHRVLYINFAFILMIYTTYEEITKDIMLTSMFPLSWVRMQAHSSRVAVCEPALNKLNIAYTHKQTVPSKNVFAHRTISFASFVESQQNVTHKKFMRTQTL